MSVRFVEHRNDDLDGSENASIRRFSIEGVPYEIDLSDENYEKMLGAFHPYVSAGRRVSKARAAGAPRTRRAAVARPAARPVNLDENAAGSNGNGAVQEENLTRDQRAAIREWAKTQGIAVSDRGRLKQQIVSMWDAAQRNGEKLETVSAPSPTRRVVRRRAAAPAGEDKAKANGRKAKEASAA